MTKNSKKSAKDSHTTEPDEFGYTAIYREIIRQVFHSKKIEDVIYWSFSPIVLVFVLALTNTTVKQGFDLEHAILWIIILFMIFSFLVIIVGWIVGFASFAFWGNNHQLGWLVARIVIAFKSPHQDRFGLTIREIGYLKAIAEVDQAAADWKSGFLTIGILSLLLTVIQGSTTDIRNFLETYILIGPPVDLIFSWPVLGVFWGWLIVSLITVLFAISIFRPLGEFLSGEPINRTIINACHESIALLETKGLNQRAMLSLIEKKLIARACNCLVISTAESKDYGFFRMYPFSDENGEAWLLLPPFAKDKTISRIVRLRRRLQTWWHMGWKQMFKKEKRQR